MSEPIVLALIGMFGIQLSAIIKGHFDTKKSRSEGRATRATVNAIEQSINNRPTSISDRLDAIQKGVDDGFEAVNTDLAAVHGDVRDLKASDTAAAGKIGALEESVKAQWTAISSLR